MFVTAPLHRADDLLHVAYCIDRKFTPYFGASVFSLLANYRADPSRLMIHVIVDHPDDGLAEGISQLRRLFRAGIRLHLAPEGDLDRLSDLPLPPASHFARANYLRLLLPSLLGKEVKRVLYLDADTIVVDDVSPLLAADIGGCAVGAVRAYSSARHARRLGLADTVNSGVMIMDLDQWRLRRLGASCARWLIDNRDIARNVDEDAINAVLAGSIFRLDARWNFQVKSGESAEHPNPAIVHFIGAAKPWHAWYDNGHGRHYWHYAHASPWKPAAPIQPETVRDLYSLACLRMKEGNHADAMRCYEGVYRAFERVVAGRRPNR